MVRTKCSSMSAMRSIVTSLLLTARSTESASCLADAMPAGQRQNLVNPNGETYPVGFIIGNWAGSYAANILAATLVEEILGYNTTANFDNIAGGSVAGYYGVAGCRSFNNATDRGCMQGVTYYHVGLETWMGYPSDWEYIQNTYTSMAPKDLGSTGYPGLGGIFLPKELQSHAYSTEGKPLEYYRTWNASWDQPWKFFGSLSSIDSSKLCPCNKTGGVLASDAVLRRHVHWTGDIDGVVINNDVYSGRCDDGIWWAAPACRSDSTKCVPWITGGTGWGVEDAMQKFTVHNMPVAVAVAVSWTEYTQVPLIANVTFYWWAPDPTFLELSPLFMIFPDFQAKEYAVGNYQSATSSTEVNTIVSSDLAVLAPFIESFARNLDLPYDEMNKMLLDQKNTGDTWRNVTCRWITANRAMWQKWIPDESECFPGFGLYDSVLQNFTQTRVNASNKIVCQACPPGMYSQELEDITGVTYVCVACGKGTSQSSGASLSCTPCKAGEYQDELQSTECKRCDFGTYQDQSGQEVCKACPQSTSTLGFGSVAETDCGCPEDYIDMDRTGNFSCVKCSEGMTCPTLSQLDDLESGESSNGGAFTPAIKEGYYSTIVAPTEVFLCTSVTSCPGGPPGSCAGGLVNTPCSQCAAGETWTGNLCEDCAGWRQALWALAVAGIFAFLILAYYLTTSKVTAKATVLFTTTASFGMLVMSMQNLGLIGMMTVPWPLSLKGLFSICQFLLLDIDSYGFSCIAGQSEPIRYLLSALIFPLGVAWLALGYAVSKLFPKKYRWEGPKVCSTMGAFLQLGFSTISATALSPMMCYKHPNGLRSILKYPGVICGSAEHDTMLVTAWLLLVVFVFGFVALCITAAWMVPKWSAQRKDHLVACVRFLVFRFRFDSWWFGVPLLLRGPLINLPVVLATDYPPIQIVSIAMILTSMMVMQMLAWPWKVPMLNATDTTVSFCVVLLVTTSTLYLNQIDETMYGFASVVSTGMLSGIGIAIFVMFLMTGSALFYRSAMGGKQELVFFNLGRVPQSQELAHKVKELVNELEKMEMGYLSKKLNQLPVFDITKVTACITLLATEVAPPAEEGHSFKFNKRIGSGSFDPALQRKTQSFRNRKTNARKTEAMADPQAAPDVAETNNENDATEPEDKMHSGWM